MTTTRALLPVMALFLSGCSLGQRFLASPTEYESYRATHVRYTMEGRLASAEDYLDKYPDGRFAKEVRAKFDDDELSFYSARSGSIDGLEWYLHVLPHGPHASEASLRLSDLEAQARAMRGDATVAAGRVIERRLAHAARERRQVADFFVGYLGALSTMRSWGRPTWEMPNDALYALRGAPDPGRCDDQTCKRITTMTYQIPIAGGGLDDRAATIEIGFKLQQGGVVEASIAGPDLLSRIWEADIGQAITTDRDSARALAVGHVLDIVGGAFEAVVPSATCEKTITPPVVMLRECNGWRVEVTIGDTPADDDTIRVRGPR
jgi:hypothetical protein